MDDPLYIFLLARGVTETLKHFPEQAIREVAKRHRLWLPKVLDAVSKVPARPKQQPVRARVKTRVPRAFSAATRSKQARARIALMRERARRRAQERQRAERVRVQQYTGREEREERAREHEQHERTRLEREHEKMRQRLEQARQFREQKEQREAQKERLEECKVVGARRAHWARNDAAHREALREQVANEYSFGVSLERLTLLDVIEDLAWPSIELTNAMFVEAEKDQRGWGPSLGGIGRHNWALLRWNFQDFEAQLAELDQRLAQLQAAEGVSTRRLNRTTAAEPPDDDWRARLVQLMAGARM